MVTGWTLLGLVVFGEVIREGDQEEDDQRCESEALEQRLEEQYGCIAEDGDTDEQDQPDGKGQFGQAALL